MIISSNRRYQQSIPPAGLWNPLLFFENSCLKLNSCSWNITRWNCCLWGCVCVCVITHWPHRTDMNNTVHIILLYIHCIWLWMHMTVGAVYYANNTQDRADMEEHFVLLLTSRLEGRVKMREQNQGWDSACMMAEVRERRGFWGYEKTVGSHLTS